MKYRTLGVGTTLYHGSVRLYQINCYIRAHYHKVVQYLEESELQQDVITEDLPSTFKSQLQEHYLDYLNQANQIFRPVTQEVLYLMTVQLLQEYGIEEYSVSAVWDTRFVHNKDQLLSFATEVEGGIVPLAELFRVDFYSTMMVPVQFFGEDRSVAEVYATRRPHGQVLTYRVLRQILLPNLSDPTTIRELGETVFSSQEIMPLSWINLHAGGTTYADCRHEILSQSLYFTGWSELLQLLNEVADPYTPLDLAVPSSVEAPRLLNKFADNWNTIFRHELLTPATLWRFVTWKLPKDRIGLYSSDALLLRVMVDHGGYDGFVNPANQELVIIHPEAYGVIDTGKMVTDPSNCPYLKE